MAYTGSVELISGIKQKNNGTFPLVDATAVRVEDDRDLKTELNGLVKKTDIVNDLVKVSETPPTSSEINKFWVHSAETEVQIPTYDEVSDIKSEIEAQELLIGGESDNLHNNSTDVVGEFYNSTGAVEAETSTKKYWKRTALIDIGEYDSVTFSGGTASLSKKNVFVGSDGTTVVKVFDTVSTGTVHVPEGAKYVGFSLNKATTNFSCVGVYNGTINDRIDALEPTVEVLESIENNGYGDLLDKSWARGGWFSYDTFSTNIKNRAGINVKQTTDKDLHLLAKRGFQLLGTAKINGETVSSTGNFSCMFYVPAGAEYILTVRRITEDSSEQLTDEQVQEFAAAVMVTNVRGSDYMRYRHTFTGFEMFESMAIIGDSYSAGNNTNNWGKCLGRMIGTEVTVWAQSGDKTSDWIVHFMPSMLAAEPKGLYWLNLGINDGGTVNTTPAYLGSSADVDETTYPDVDDFPNTFWGNYGRIIRNIQIHAPNAKLILEKTLFANMRNAQADGESSATLTINNAIGDIAEYYGLPCIDQLDDAFYTSKEYADSMTANHPRAYTWPGMANANRRLFAKCVFDNPEYFY